MPIEVHLEKRIINSNVVREEDPKSRCDYIVVTVLAGMFLFGLFVYAWQHYQWIQYSYRIEEAKKKKEQVVEARRQLQLENASLRNPGRIDKIARRELGMVSPAPGQLVTIHADTPLTIPAPQPAQPVQSQQAEVQPQPAALSLKR